VACWTFHLVERKLCTRFCQLRLACACPAGVSAGGCGSCFLHASIPVLRSSIMPGSVSLSRRCSRSCKIAVSHRTCASGCGHWRIWPVSSSGCPQSAVGRNFIFAIRHPVAQNPVMNFVVHLRILIVWPETTVSIVAQSTRLVSISRNLVFPAQ